MIDRIDSATAPVVAAPASTVFGRRSRLEADLSAAVRGEVRFDGATRAVFATDSSNYRHVPIGVVFPIDADDVVAVLRVCAQHDAPVLARGAGTSLAGQACNEAVVIDTSRHMTRILDIDAGARLARVEPGVVLDDLRSAAERHGLTFGPDPATHAWCTVGGMIGNNACGSHALYAGKTVENVERLTVALYGGDVIDAGPADPDRIGEIPDPVLARIARELREIRDAYAARIRAGFPVIPRRVSGYNLDELLPERGFHLARAFVGSESTCGVVTEAVLRLVPSLPHRRLLLVGYADVFTAADAVPELLRFGPIALEGFDDTLVEQMRSHGLNPTGLALLPPGRAWLMVELGASTCAEVDAQAERVLAELPPELAVLRFDDATTQRQIWAVRESALGATAVRSDGSLNHEGWEDAAVAPERLGAYLRAVTALWAEFGYSGAWYGHFGQGCVHTRNNFDLGTPGGRAQYRQFVERAADLVVSLGGSLSGEHGDGQARSELLGRMFGAELVEAFSRFKAAFDPRGRMNPGRIVDPRPLDTDFRQAPPARGRALGPSITRFPPDGRSLQELVERCVGVGKCRTDLTGTMCPSYRVTRDEAHSTRGRARLLAEMFRGEVVPSTWRSHEVKEALDLCLSCKGCAVDCPTGVDIAAYKSEFLAHYYERRLRPLAMVVLGRIPWIARAFSRIAWVPNAILAMPGLGMVVRRVAGITTARPMPRFASLPFRRRRATREVADRLEATVVLFADTFTNAFRPSTGDDLLAVLEALGERVAVPSGWACCGRPLYDAGMLGTARRALGGLLDVLDPWISRGVPVIVPEPSCLATFRMELPSLLPGDPRAAALAGLARSPAEHLLATGRLRPPTETTAPLRAVVHPHCHGRAVGTPAADLAVLRTIGFDPVLLDAGCCGLAGSFGYRAEHEPISRRIGDELWLPKLESALEAQGADGAVLVVDGFSCDLQLQALSSRRPTTLAALVRDAIS